MDLTKKNKERKKGNSVDLSTMVYGKIPPQATDLEEAILGTLLQFRESFGEASEIIKAECFYVESHQKIYKAIQNLITRSQPVDILTVKEELLLMEQLENIGGAFYLTKLTNSVSSPAHLASHCRIVFEKFVQRELIKIGSEMIGYAYEDSSDPFDLLNEFEERISSLSADSVIGDMTGIDKVLINAVQQIEDWRHLDSSITGIPTGFVELDRITRGWQPGDLIIIAARPSKGKTAFMLRLLASAGRYFINHKKQKTAKVWSLEMKALRLVLRMLAAESRENLYRIQTGRLDEGQMRNIYHQGVQKLAMLPIFFDDTSGANVRKIRAKAKKKHDGKETGIVFVDYLQLVDPSGDEYNREQEVSKMSRGLKKMAQELEIPVIALSQLSRDVEKRGRANQEPQLSDLRESGAIEQDADVVIFLWGPTDEEIQADSTLADLIYLKIAKQRDGMLATVKLRFKSEYQLFTEIEKEGMPEGNWRQVQTGIDFTQSKREQNSE